MNKKIICLCITTLVLTACGDSDNKSSNNNSRNSGGAPSIPNVSNITAKNMSNIVEAVITNTAAVITPDIPELLEDIKERHITTGADEIIKECTNSGTITSNAALSSSEDLTKGDTFKLKFDNCDEGEDEVNNGAMSVVVNSFGFIEDSIVSYSFSAGVELDKYSTLDLDLDDGETVEVSGSLSMDMSYKDGILTYNESSDTVEIVTSDSSPDDSITNKIDNQTFSMEYDLDTSSISYSIGGKLTNNEVGGPFEYNTLEPMVLDLTTAITPQSGKIKIASLDKSNVTVTFNSSVDILMELDLGGDGSIDDSQNISIGL